MKKYHFFLIVILLNLNLISKQKILCITIPKSGSHLLTKCINLLTNETVTYDDPITTDKDNIFYHLTHNKENSQKIKEISEKHKVIKFFIMRDPRDQVVSFVLWGMTRSTWLNYKNLSFNEVLLSLICFGNTWYSFKGDKVNGILEFYDLFLPWLQDKNHEFCFIKFEDLVGSQGNGKDQLQNQEITKIAKHLGLELNEEQIKNVTKNLFGNTNTFREGKIGSWKKLFQPIHKECFKRIAGQLLIDLGYEKDLNW